MGRGVRGRVWTAVKASTGARPYGDVHGKEGFSVGSTLFFVWVIMFRAARQGAGVPDETTAGEGIGETGYGR